MSFVISRSGVRVTPLAPQNTPKTMVFGVFCYVKSSGFQRAASYSPTRRPTRVKNRSAPAGKFGFPTDAPFCLGDGVLPHLCHEVAHGLRCLVLLLAGGVGVGPQGKSGIVVPQHSGDRFDVHTVLEGQGGEGMTEIVEAKVFQTSVLQNALVQGSHRVRYVLLWFRVRVIL